MKALILTVAIAGIFLLAHPVFGAEFSKIYSARTPLGRMASANDIAETVRFLVSPGGQYITGQNILVDGGWSIY